MEEDPSSSFSSEDGSPQPCSYVPLGDFASEEDEDSGEGFSYSTTVTERVEIETEGVEIDTLIEERLYMDVNTVPLPYGLPSGGLDENKEKALNSVALKEFDARYKEHVETSISPSPQINMDNLLSSLGELSQGKASLRRF